MDPATLTWRVEGNQLEFLAEGRVVCRAIDSAAPPTDDDLFSPIEPISPWEIDGSRATRSFTCGPWLVQDAIERQTSADVPLYEWRRSRQNRSPHARRARLCLEWEIPSAPHFTLMPAVSYDGNAWGSGKEPKGLAYDGQPWTFAAHRMSVPAGTYSEGDAGSVFVYADPASIAPPGCSAALAPVEGGLRHRLVWPEEESPRSYTSRDLLGPASSASLEIAPDGVFEATAYLVILPPARLRTNWRHGLDAAWMQFHRAPHPWFSPEELWKLAVRYARESLWYEGPEFTGFSTGLWRRQDRDLDGSQGPGWVQRPWDRFEIGWCGQNAALAVALLQDYLNTGNAGSLDQGVKTLDFWADHARLPNGLFWTLFDQKIENTASPRLDTCNLGHGAYQYLIATELAEQCGIHRPQWAAMARDACDFFVEHVLPDGTFGTLWSPGGDCLQAGGTTGAFLLWPLLKLHRGTGQDHYLHAAQRAFETYVTRDLDQACCGGGALDTDCIDKESAFPLAMAALDLYDLTGEAGYLRRAEDAGYYLASWQWHYSAPLPAGSAMSQLGYDTYGGTSVSVGHHHQDPWGALLALAWLRLAKATGRAIWQDRARAAWAQATIGISDGSLEVYGVRRPVGSQDEGFLHTSWGAGRTGLPRGSVTGQGDVSEWLVAWPSAFRLITLMHWPDWDDLR